MFCVCDFVSDLAAPSMFECVTVITLSFSSVWTALTLLSFKMQDCMEDALQQIVTNSQLELLVQFNVCDWAVSTPLPCYVCQLSTYSLTRQILDVRYVNYHVV